MPVTFSDEGSNIDSGGYRDPEALRQAIEDLAPAQRTAIEMLKLREMSLKEAAAARGTTIGALKVSAHRARATRRNDLIKESCPWTPRNLSSGWRKLSSLFGRLRVHGSERQPGFWLPSLMSHSSCSSFRRVRT